jgi:hypothetical protein
MGAKLFSLTKKRTYSDETFENRVMTIIFVI